MLANKINPILCLLVPGFILAMRALQGSSLINPFFLFWILSLYQQYSDDSPELILLVPSNGVHDGFFLNLANWLYSIIKWYTHACQFLSWWRGGRACIPIFQVFVDFRSVGLPLCVSWFFCNKWKNDVYSRKNFVLLVPWLALLHLLCIETPIKSCSVEWYQWSCDNHRQRQTTWEEECLQQGCC